MNGVELELNLIRKLSLFQGESLIHYIIVTDVQAGRCVCFVLTTLIERVHLGISIVLRFGGVNRTICDLAYLRVVSSLRLLTERSFEVVITAFFTDARRSIA